MKLSYYSALYIGYFLNIREGAEFCIYYIKRTLNVVFKLYIVTLLLAKKKYRCYTVLQYKYKYADGRMVDWAKSLLSGSFPVLLAWVQIPLVTKIETFLFKDLVTFDRGDHVPWP